MKLHVVRTIITAQASPVAQVSEYILPMPGRKRPDLHKLRHAFAAGLCYIAVSAAAWITNWQTGVVGLEGFPKSCQRPSLCVRGHYGQDALSASAGFPITNQEHEAFCKSTWTKLSHRLLIVARIISRYGPTSVGVIAGNDCTNEDTIYLHGLLDQLYTHLILIPRRDSLPAPLNRACHVVKKVRRWVSGADTGS